MKWRTMRGPVTRLLHHEDGADIKNWGGDGDGIAEMAKYIALLLDYGAVSC